MFTRDKTRREKIVRFVRQYVEEHGFPPSFREIAKAVGVRSTKAVKYHLDILAEQGILGRTPGRARSLRSGVQPNSLPLVGRIAAGSPVLAVENIEANISLSRFQDCFLLRVHGESMTGAGIMDGDMVIVRREAEPKNGDIVVALLGDEATVKRFQREDGRITLLPENPEFRPIVIQEPEYTTKTQSHEGDKSDSQTPTADGQEPATEGQFKVIGIVVGLLRNYK